MNPLAGKPLRYLIGADGSGPGQDGAVTVVPYDCPQCRLGISVAYCNLFDENGEGEYGPYLHTSDTAEEYGEGQIDPKGPGWNKNLTRQFEFCKANKFQYIELDNADAYDIKDVIGAIELAAKYGLKVIAKNPGAMDNGSVQYIAHPNVYGVIVEKDCGTVAHMADLRKRADKPDLPIWFVYFGETRSAAKYTAQFAALHRNMGATWSRKGEYESSEDILKPR